MLGILYWFLLELTCLVCCKFDLKLMNIHHFQAGAAGGAMAGTMATSDGHRYILMGTGDFGHIIRPWVIFS